MLLCRETREAEGGYDCSCLFRLVISIGLFNRCDRYGELSFSVSYS
jgi:hypothetical protein